MKRGKGKHQRKDETIEQKMNTIEGNIISTRNEMKKSNHERNDSGMKGREQEGREERNGEKKISSFWEERKEKQKNE